MKERFILMLLIKLTYLEFLKNGNVTTNSLIVDTIEIVDSVLNSNKILGNATENNKALLHYVKEMLESNVLDKEMLIQKIKATLTDDAMIANVINCFEEVEDVGISIKSVYREIENFTMDKVIEKILNTASFTFSRNRNEITDKRAFLSDLVSNIEKHTQSKGSDSAIVDKVDLEDRNGIRDVYNRIANSYAEGDLLLTGWQYLNDMTAGGLRRGEFVTIASLQHKYKSGLSVSLFIQLAQFNKPILRDESKKPLLVLFSLEDDVKNVFEFIFRYIKRDKEGIAVKLSDFTTDEITDYVHAFFKETGWHLKVFRVDPTKWSYRGFMDEIEDLERNGYEIVATLVDYLGLVPTIGCLKDGPMGTDVRDMFRRVRNFISAKGILFLTPHQLSVGAKNLIRNGVSDLELVKEVEGKGYYAGSGQLDQEIDLELYGHVAKVGGESYLTIQRGKHRLPTTVSEDKKYFLLKFPKDSPIPGDLGKENTGIRKLDGGLGDGLGELIF